MVSSPVFTSSKAVLQAKAGGANRRFGKMTKTPAFALPSPILEERPQAQNLSKQVQQKAFRQQMPHNDVENANQHNDGKMQKDTSTDNDAPSVPVLKPFPTLESPKFEVLAETGSRVRPAPAFVGRPKASEPYEPKWPQLAPSTVLPQSNSGSGLSVSPTSSSSSSNSPPVSPQNQQPAPLRSQQKLDLQREQAEMEQKVEANKRMRYIMNRAFHDYDVVRNIRNPSFEALQRFQRSTVQ